MTIQDYVFHLDPKADDIKQFLSQHPLRHLFQHSRWHEVKENWSFLEVAIMGGGKIRAYAMILVRPLFLGQSMFYIPRGPVMDYQNEKLCQFMFTNLKTLAKRHHAIMIRFDPNLCDRTYEFNRRQDRGASNSLSTIQLLQKYKCHHHGFTTYLSQSTQPRFQAVIPLDKMNWESLSPKTRRSINHSQKCGVELQVGHQYLAAFCEVMNQTEVRKNIHLRNKDYFSRMLEVYRDDAILMVATLDLSQRLQHVLHTIQEVHEQIQDSNNSHALLDQLTNLEKEEQFLLDKIAQHQNHVVLSGVLALVQDDQMEVLYAGTHSEYMRYRGSYLTHWFLMKQASQQKITRCNLGGVEGTLEDGLSGFKGNFPIQIEEMIGEFDIAVNPILTWSINKLIPAIKKVRKRRKVSAIH